MNIDNLETSFKCSIADLTILEQIEKEPETTQATLAKEIGVAVGTINWHLKRLISKGYIKVKRTERKKLKYIITPEGIALRTRLLMDYIQSSMELYRLVRERSLKAVKMIREKGVNTVHLEGEGEVAEILKLTCHEQGILLSNNHPQAILKVVGLKIFIEEPHGNE